MRILWSPKRWQQSRENQAESGLSPQDVTGEEPEELGAVLISNQEEGQQLPILLEAEPVAAESPVGSAEGSKRLMATAGLIGVGQLLASTLGFVRIETLNVLFYGVASGPFVIALKPIQMVSDLLVGGSVSGALIPTFTDYSDPSRRRELRRIYNTLINFILLLMSVAVAGVFFAAPYFIPFATAGFTPQQQQLTVTLVRIVAFSLYGLGLYAATSALLYALREVVYPAFATGMYHIGIIVLGVGALVLGAKELGVPLHELFEPGTVSASLTQAREIGAHGLALGAAIGALAEFLVLLPVLGKVRVLWQPVLDLRHPAVRRIFILYAPVALGLVISLMQQSVDLVLAGRTPGGASENVTAMQSATTLVQFPIGLVVAALSFTVLPPLTKAATNGNMAEFKHTVVIGIRLGLLLMIPSMVGLEVLRVPIVSMLFQHGTCDHGCTVRNALALQNYAWQLPFVAIDQILIAAFYARKNTVWPMIVGLISILFYLSVALPFSGTIGMPALAFADTLKNASHAIILFVLLTIAIGSLGTSALAGGIWRIVLAALVMTLVCWGLLNLLPSALPHVFNTSKASGQALIFLVAGGAGSVAYFTLVSMLGVEEVRLVGSIIRSRIGRRRQP
ncbi:MAG: murein biosynthesis integral membrane protein MurJ [Ktedonobacterales bacterium]